MADFFISRLPAGHPVKDIARAAATTTIRNEKMVVAAPESLVSALRRQCAAVIWVRSDVYSLKNLEKLNLTDRAFLLKLFGLPAGGTAKIQAKRIDDHVAKHPLPAADGQQGNGGGGGGGGGGGQGNGGGHGAPANDGDGGADGGGGVQQHGGGGAVGLAGALLPSDQADALHRTARPAILRMLKAAGVPYSDGDSLAMIRSKCAAAAWAAEQLRQPDDVHSLPGTIPAQVVAAFGRPAGWARGAQDAALSAVLGGCRDAPWALDPASAHGILSVHRTGIFRAVESIALPSRGGAPRAGREPPLRGRVQQT